jgi:hypothetical protein
VFRLIFEELIGSWRPMQRQVLLEIQVGELIENFDGTLGSGDV